MIIGQFHTLMLLPVPLPVPVLGAASCQAAARPRCAAAPRGLLQPPATPRPLQAVQLAIHRAFGQAARGLGLPQVGLCFLLGSRCQRGDGWEQGLPSSCKWILPLGARMLAGSVIPSKALASSREEAIGILLLFPLLSPPTHRRVPYRDMADRQDVALLSSQTLAAIFSSESCLTPTGVCSPPLASVLRWPSLLLAGAEHSSLWSLLTSLPSHPGIRSVWLSFCATAAHALPQLQAWPY